MGSCIIYNLTFVFNLATTFQIYWINHLTIQDQSFDYSGSIICLFWINHLIIQDLSFVYLGSNLSISIDEPLICRDLFECHWSARTEFLGRYSYLCAKSELTSIGEAGRSIDIDA